MRYEHQSVVRRIIVTALGVWCLVVFVGCEAFIRKFTRKPKNKKSDVQEMVLVPEEYKGPQMSKEELYRQYILFWKSWHDELLNSLSSSRSHKKRVSCIDEAIKNINDAFAEKA